MSVSVRIAVCMWMYPSACDRMCMRMCVHVLVCMYARGYEIMYASIRM